VLGDVVTAGKEISRNSDYNVRVINIPTLKPIDEEIIIESAKTSEYLFTVEDHSIVGGLGSAVSEVLTDNYPKKVTRIGLNDIFPESAPPSDLYEKYGLSSNQITKRVLNESMDK
jgi:transketolase